MSELLVLQKALEEYWLTNRKSRKDGPSPREWLVLPGELARQLLDDLSIAETGMTIRERLVEESPAGRREIEQVLAEFDKYKV